MYAQHGKCALLASYLTDYEKSRNKGNGLMPLLEALNELKITATCELRFERKQSVRKRKFVSGIKQLVKPNLKKQIKAKKFLTGFRDWKWPVFVFRQFGTARVQGTAWV